MSDKIISYTTKCAYELSFSGLAERPIDVKWDVSGKNCVLHTLNEQGLNIRVTMSRQQLIEFQSLIPNILKDLV